MKVSLTVFACGLLLAVAAVTSAQAQDITATVSSTTAWVGTPTFETGAAPTTGSGGTSQDNDNWGGNAHGVSGFGSLGMAFEVTSPGTLSTAELVFAGGPGSFGVELYDLGPVANYPGYQAAPGNTPTITQLNNVGGAGLPNLLAAGDQFTFNGTGSQTLVSLAFGGADSSINLSATELYMLALDPTANADGIWWVRGGVPIAAYNTGEGMNVDGVNGYQQFEGKTSVRDFDLGIVTSSVSTPEPGTIALGVMGASALLLRRRVK
jgi:uncharacterized protein (TIGR03382 family)